MCREVGLDACPNSQLYSPLFFLSDPFFYMNLSKNEDTKARILGYHQAHQTCPVSPHTNTARPYTLS